MPVNTTAPVTARDHFVVAFTEEELRQRIAEFRDLSIPDDEIRRRYFTRTRSARYETGRHPQLEAGRRPPRRRRRRRLATPHRPLPLPPVRLALRLLAPGDDRLAADGSNAAPDSEFENRRIQRWRERGAREMTDLTLHLSHSRTLRPLCLIARRQQLPTQPCTFFWIADGLALDGVIRSDNRGSESLFPLYVREARRAGEQISRRRFVAEAERTTQPDLAAAGPRRSGKSVRPGGLAGLHLRAVSRADLSRAICGGAADGFSARRAAAEREQFCRLSRCGTRADRLAPAAGHWGTPGGRSLQDLGRGLPPEGRARFGPAATSPCGSGCSRRPLGGRSAVRPDRRRDRADDGADAADRPATSAARPAANLVAVTLPRPAAWRACRGRPTSCGPTGGKRGTSE